MGVGVGKLPIILTLIKASLQDEDLKRDIL